MPFYLSHPDDRPTILQSGISAGDDGYIDIFTDNLVANTIARDQLFLDRYTLFWITPAGITAEARRNDVGILTAKYQFRIQQSRVDERFVRVMGEYEVIRNRPTTWDYLFWSRRGFLQADVNEQFEIRALLESGSIAIDRANALLDDLSDRVNARQGMRRRRKSKTTARDDAPTKTNLLSALRTASARLEKAWSAVRKLPEIARGGRGILKRRRNKSHNPYHDLSK
jgi:hypothetical protein